MLATHTIDPEDLFTISAGGFNATADAFARDDRTDGLWFVSMVGSQTALKAIWASLLKQPPDTAHIIKGADGMALSGGYQRCVVPYETIGTWTTKIAACRVSGGWHALVYTKTAEFGYEKDSFLLLAQVGGGGSGAPPPLPRQGQPRCPFTAPGLAGSGSEGSRMGKSCRSSRSEYPLTGAPQGPEAEGRPVRRGGVGPAHAASGGVRWIGR